MKYLTDRLSYKQQVWALIGATTVLAAVVVVGMTAAMGFIAGQAVK